MASAPHCFGSVARHFGAPPPPHSSLNSTFVASLLNVAECQYEKFESATASRRMGFVGSLMSIRNPKPSHAPPAYPMCGYIVMSWHCMVSWRGSPPLPPTALSTMDWNTENGRAHV